MNVPEKITVQLQSQSVDDLSGIIVELKVIAGRKNPYFIRFPKTDSFGRAAIGRDDFIGQFKDHWEMGLMDYDGSVESASPVVEASLFDPNWSINNPKLALAWPLLAHERAKWSSREQEYASRISCRNPLFAAETARVDLSESPQISLQIEPR